jgi:general secretion pathway protein D
MMLASVSTNVATDGRAGLPFLGGLPILGRFFTSPTRDNRQIDIVISVTPRVLRAPAVTPRDEEMRPSGTLQSPTTGSLAEMIREADREDQIAAARVLPKDVSLQLPDAPVVKPVETVSQNTTPANLPPPAGTYAFQPVQKSATPVVTAAQNNQPVAPLNNSPAATAQNNPPVMTAPDTKPAPAVTAQNNNKPAAVEELPSFVPAPKSLISDQAAANVAAVNTGTAGTQNAVLTSLPKATETSLDTKLPGTRVAQLSLLPEGDVMKVGDKRRYAIQLNSDVDLSMALVALRFDPKVVRVNGVTAGTLLPASGDSAPLVTPVIDPASGACVISITSRYGKAPFKGSGALLFIEVEAVGVGDAGLTFAKDTLHLVASDARDVTSQLIQGTATVKQ